MLVLKERIINLPIMSLQTSAEIARTEQPIIDPRQLKVVAFYCQGPQLDAHPAVLHVDDIREISNLGYIVDSAEVIMSPDGLVRLQQVIGFNFILEGKQVVEESGRKVGKVSNYTVNTRSFYITQLHVQPSLWQAWATAEILIGRTQIIEINDTKIIVKSATIRKEAPVQAKSRIVENPFRPQPQAEATRTARE